MNKSEQEEIDELASDLAYQRLKFSPLYDKLENDEIDNKAESFANLIKLHLEELIDKSVTELERESDA